MTAPTRATPAGRAYLDLRKKARQGRRPVDELMQLDVLESFLARLAATRFADRFVLKGGVLLAAFGERRPTRDIEIAVRGYPLAMVHAEKIVTAISRGTTSTRWRDFADMYLLARHHATDGAELSKSIREVAKHRDIQLAPLSQVLADYGGIGQHRWEAWRRRQRLDDRLPSQFSEVVQLSRPSPTRPSPALLQGSPGTRRLAGGRDRDGHPSAIRLAHRAAMGQGAAASGPEHRSRSQHGHAHLAS